ncbi:MAG: hypothetical protein RR051_02080 [Clostridiales bacterium]
MSKRSGTGFEPIPEGSHIAICVGLYDIGTQRDEKYDKVSKKVIVTWELPDVTVQGGDHEGEPRLISKTYTASLSDRAALRADLESWRGRSFTEEELEEFDLANILSKPCMLQIIHSQNGGKTYANIKTIVPVYKGIPVPKPVNPLRAFDMDSNSWRWELDNGSLPEWIVNKVKESAIYKESQNQAEPGDAPETDEAF